MEETNDRHIREAIRIVGSWYANDHDLKTLSDEAINKIIWEKQVE
jgi:hypothetical protein